MTRLIVSILTYAAGGSSQAHGSRTSSRSRRREEELKAQYREEKQEEKQRIKSMRLQLQRDVAMLRTEELDWRLRDIEYAKREYARLFRSFKDWREATRALRRASNQVIVQEVIDAVGDPVPGSGIAGSSNAGSARPARRFTATGQEILPGV